MRPSETLERIKAVNQIMLWLIIFYSGFVIRLALDLYCDEGSRACNISLICVMVFFVVMTAIIYVRTRRWTVQVTKLRSHIESAERSQTYTQAEFHLEQAEAHLRDLED